MDLNTYLVEILVDVEAKLAVPRPDDEALQVALQFHTDPFQSA